MNQDEIESIFIYMNLVNEKIYIKNEYIFFKDFKDLKSLFIKYDKVTGDQLIIHHDNIFKLNFISEKEGLLKTESYSLNSQRFGISWNNHDGCYLSLILSNNFNKYYLKIDPYRYDKIFVKKIEGYDNNIYINYLPTR